MGDFKKPFPAEQKASVSSPIHRDMPRLSRDQRHQALGLAQGGVAYHEIADRMGCCHATIRRLIERHRETGSVADRPRPGRERVTTPAQDRHVRLMHLRDRFRTAAATARETQGVHGRHISGSTVERRLRNGHLAARRPYRGNMLTAPRRQRRLEWCRQHSRWTRRQWNGVLFTDESRFCIDRADGRERVWRRTGERYADCCVREADRWGGPSAMVWGGITNNHRTPLLVLEGNLNARRYIDEVLEPCVIPFLEQHQDVGILQQDNARPHAARITTAYLHENNVNVMQWPAFSPDLSPIEHLWDQIGQLILRRTPRPANRPQLIHALQEEWNNIPQGRIQRLIGSMRRRCRKCVDARGGHIPY